MTKVRIGSTAQSLRGELTTPCSSIRLDSMSIDGFIGSIQAILSLRQVLAAVQSGPVG